MPTKTDHRLSTATIRALVEARHDDPFAVLKRWSVLVGMTSLLNRSRHDVLKRRPSSNGSQDGQARSSQTVG